jgi:hypothetical protein
MRCADVVVKPKYKIEGYLPYMLTPLLIDSLLSWPFVNNNKSDKVGENFVIATS